MIRWLQDFVSQLIAARGLGAGSTEIDESEHNLFFQESIGAVRDSKGDGRIVHRFLNAHQHLFDPTFGKSLPALAAQFLNESKGKSRSSRASLINSLAVDLQQFPRGDRAQNLEIAIECYQQTLFVYTHDAYPEDWAKTQENLAILYTEEGQNELAIRYYQQALEIFTPEASPINALKANWGLGNIYFTQGEWQLAVDIYTLGIQAAETSRNWATNEDERQRIIREAISVYEQTIQAYINLGQIDKAITTSERAAVIALEAKQQSILQQIREQDAIAAGQLEVIPVEFATIQSLIKTPATAILTFYTTDDDTHIFIITQTGSPQLFTLPGQGFQTFQQWLNQQWSLPYRLSDLKPQFDKMTPEQQQEFAQANNIDEKSLTIDWHDRMNDNLAEIAARLQLPQLIAQLPNITELVIVPHLSLHQISFAALPLNTLLGGVPEGWGGSFLGDRFTIRYVPSCQILKYCTDRPSIESPCYGTVADTDGTLLGAIYESDRIAELYQILDDFRLRGKQASKANYLDLLSKINNLLSSHHGTEATARTTWHIVSSRPSPQPRSTFNRLCKSN